MHKAEHLNKSDVVPKIRDFSLHCQLEAYYKCFLPVCL